MKANFIGPSQYEGTKFCFKILRKPFDATMPKPAYGWQGLAWIVRPEYDFGVFSTSCLAPAALSSVELVVRLKRYKQTDAPYRKL